MGEHPRVPRSFPSRLAAIALAGLAVRVLYTVLVGRHSPGVGDYFFYQGAANELADGRGYIDPFLSTAGHPYSTALHPPAWPFLLAIGSKLGATSFLAHRLVGCLVGAVVVAELGLLGRRVGGDRVGLVAAGIAAAYPTLIAADGSLMSETLYGAFVAAALLLAYRLLDRPSTWTAAALGATIGLSALTRGEGLLFLPLLALPVAWRGGLGRAFRLTAAVAGAAIVIAPWTARNWITFDRPVLLSTNDSTVLAGANCSPTYHGSDLGFWRLDCVSERRPGLNEAEQAAIWRREGRVYARDHAGRLAAVVAPVRVLRAWDLWQPRRQTRLAEGRSVRVTQAGTAVFYVLAALAVYGLVLLRRRGATLLVLLCPIVVVTLSSAASFGLPRFRQAAELALVVLAAVAVDALAARRAAVSARSAPVA
jgi:4-amino-4-deoxy-L-arabinose transferase-like glycosyltransferase